VLQELARKERADAEREQRDRDGKRISCMAAALENRWGVFNLL
jgi:hypothetical protein